MKKGNYSGSREEVQLLADKLFGQPEKKLNFWLIPLTQGFTVLLHSSTQPQT